MRKLSESVWGDIRKRAEGQTVRQEDDIDKMTWGDFYNYWKSMYNIISKKGWKTLEYTHGGMGDRDTIITPIEFVRDSGFTYTYGVKMVYNFRKDEIVKIQVDYFELFVQDYPNFLDVLGSEYTMDENDTIIKVVSGEYKFHHYIDIVDKLLGMVKKPYVEKVNESVWGDIRKRAEGMSERQEDNVNNLDGQGLLNYLEKHYQTRKSPYNPNNSLWNMFIDINKVITIPVIFMGRSVSGKDNYNCFIRYYTYDNTVTIGYNIKDISEKLFNLLNERYIVSSDRDNTRMTICYIIKPKDGGESSNSFLLEVLDFILDNIPQDAKQLIMKKENVNESVWGDMRKRAEGTSVRQEDEMNNIKKLKPVDMGGPVLWADRDLELDGQYLFKFNEIPPLIEGSGWRLPTLEDIYTLDTINKGSITVNKDCFYFGNRKLVFYKRGMIYNTSVTHGNEIITDDDFYFGWTSDVYKGEQINIYTFDDGEMVYTPKVIKSVMDPIVDNENSKFCVRLVRDK